MGMEHHKYEQINYIIYDTETELIKIYYVIKIVFCLSLR